MNLEHRILQHQFRLNQDCCMWCGSTREQIVEFGEAACPRREPHIEPWVDEEQ